MLEVRNVYKSFEVSGTEHMVLDDLSFTVQDREFYIVLAVLTLQVINHEERAVQFLCDQWIVGFVICLECFARCQQFI